MKVTIPQRIDITRASRASRFLAGLWNYAFPAVNFYIAGTLRGEPISAPFIIVGLITLIVRFDL